MPTPGSIRPRGGTTLLNDARHEPDGTAVRAAETVRTSDEDAHRPPRKNDDAHRSLRESDDAHPSLRESEDTSCPTREDEGARPATRENEDARRAVPGDGNARRALLEDEVARRQPREAVAAIPVQPHPAGIVVGDAVGSVLDLHVTGAHVVDALAPAFCDAASVYLLERWLVDETVTASADAPQVEARRVALRMGAEGSGDGASTLPIDEVLVFPRHTPYARALATGGTQVLDAVDAHTSDRLASSGPGDARIRALLRTASFMVVPVRLQGVAIGFVACTRGPHLPAFGSEEVRAVESLAARAAVALDNARRYELERRTAMAIRKSLMPDTSQAFEGCRVAYGYRPAGRDSVIGGDWFDVLPRPGRRVGLIVGDAMGHGPEAAVAMIQLRTAARTLAGLDADPQGLLRRLDSLAADTPGASFATCTYVEWDAERHLCTLVGAGHPPPLTWEPGRPARPVGLGAGLPLGLNAWNSEPTVLTISRPTLVLLYSDGLVESRSTDIDAGIARLGRALDRGAARLPASGGDRQQDLQALCDRLLQDAPQDATTDDRTLLLTELTPAQP